MKTRVWTLSCVAALALAGSTSFLQSGIPPATQPGASTAPAVGVLKAVPSNAQVEAIRCPPLTTDGNAFVAPSPGNGTVNPRAKVATLFAGRGLISVAIDTLKAEDVDPNVVRMDFSGKGKFTDGLAIPLKISRGGSTITGEFGPAVVAWEGNGRKIPVQVAGQYYNYGDSMRFIQLTLGTAAEGLCRFGEKICFVRLVDGNGNQQVSDSPQIRRDGRGNIADTQWGDTLIVYDGQDAKQPVLARTFAGSPVRLNNQWFEVHVTADGGSIAAQAIDLPTGQIQVKHKHWSALFIGQKKAFYLAGEGQALALPQDRYVISEYQEESDPDAAGHRASLSVGANALAGEAQLVEVSSGKTVELAIGSPLVAKVTVTAQSSFLGVGADRLLGLDLRDAAGHPLTSFALGNGQRPPEPQVEIFDAAGKKIYTAKLEYG